jgi:hypothetical protein
MTAALAEAKQKLASNSDHPISDSIDDVLTRDNLHLSEPTNSENLTIAPFAVDCKKAFDGFVTEYIRASVAENTQRAYWSDLERFEILGRTNPCPARNGLW